MRHKEVGDPRAYGATSPMTKQEFERELERLKRNHETRADNLGCIACDACEQCTDCTFCKRSRHLVRCHYSIELERSIDCVHCVGSIDLIACSHCRSSQRCARSAYLERCLECSDCTYCFGCVGLSGREFHILNEPYDRSSYFAMIRELA